MQNRIKAFFSIYLIFFLSYSLAQSGNGKIDFKVKELSNIPENDVNCIFYDSKGFMWIGTLDGLHRYDGYSYKTFRVDNSKNSISSNMIIAIDEDSQGNIWIGTYGKGICKLNTSTNTFSHYNNTTKNFSISNDVTTLLVDKNDYIWIGNFKQLTRLKLDKNLNKITDISTFSFDKKENEGLYSIKSIFQDKNNDIWIGTNINTFRVIDTQKKLENSNFQSFECRGDAFCNFEDGVLIAGNEINSITKKNNSYKLSFIAEFQGTSLYYKKKQIWLGQRTGVKLLIKENTEWKILQQFKNNLSKNSLRSNIVTCITTDNLDQIWVGTRGGGINIISQNTKNFYHYKQTLQEGSLPNNLLRAIYEDSNGNLWVGTEEKGVSLLRNNGNYENNFIQINVNNDLLENRVYAITEMKTPYSENQENLIWLGSSYGANLIAINPDNLKIKKSHPVTPRIGFVFSLETLNDSILLAGTYNNGLWILTTDKNGDIINHRQYTPNTKSKLSSFIIRSIFKDINNNIWIGTDKGLNYIDSSEIYKQNPKIIQLNSKNFNLPFDYILQITQTRDGFLWIGTMGGGLIKCLHKENNDFTFSSITTKNGLPNNSIKTIVEDDNGILWLATNKGLSKYNPENNTIINFDKDDGLQANEFSEICGLKRRNGEIVFGGINGFNTFKANELGIDKTKPKLYFTDFFILNKRIERGDSLDGKLILKNVIEKTKEIELEFKHNSFSIGFVGLHFSSPHKNSYKYKLEGFDKEWYKASPEYRIAKYTNVPFGEYSFKIMAANSDNVWCDEAITLKIKINPPFYRSKIAYFVYLVVFLTIVYIVYKVIEEIAQKKRELLIANLEKEKVEEISKAKLQFFTNISHEFRTPLTLISTPLQQIISSGDNMTKSEKDYHLTIIQKNTSTLMRLINQLLDFRKYEQNKLRLKPSEVSLNEFLNSIFETFVILSKQKNIDYKFIPVAENIKVWLDANKIERVIFNLLSNAFKFTPENGSITLKVDLYINEGYFNISVADTGIGITEKESNSIFERYYQTQDKKKLNFSGTGIGLAFSKGLVELHKGEIFFKPNENKGTVFFVKLGLNKEHFSEDSFVENVSTESSVNQSIHTTIETDEKLKLKAGLPKILIVEDNYDIRKQIKSIFFRNFNIVEAENGKEGIDVCKTQFPDVIISDVMMPELDGIEMCKILKENEETSHIPILILTAKNTEDTRLEGYEIGADGYLSKPFNPDMLRARIKSLINNREQMRLRFQKDVKINPKVISNTPIDEKFLNKILLKIEENLSNSEYSVEQLAQDYGVSRIYLNRKIKALTGETTNQFMRNIRLKHAAELLKQNKLTISEVTWEVGYNDLKTFRNRFKEKFKMTPSEFANQYKE